ncbi:hypothetical protein VCRA2128O305_370030 [Vibrio crassostreae]|nr:hypothetical protein VCRA2112O187_140042 [Vibrio crassostreae]CAK1924419.1 hypothetical protein VCRA2112O185_220042 [Vibrio crassostreae]CAK1925589.1 hypothetical protein VCRA2112E186_230053 [Vibrio crassostreae]CAK1932269.1 hypothetical protein VCRA2118O239_240030 [Vibrio crassostreae]CAK1936867.1 hypothetical protein VCRA2119O245_260053 [Vibrio crassostreae]
MAKAALSFHLDTPETMSAEVSFVVPGASEKERFSLTETHLERR